LYFRFHSSHRERAFTLLEMIVVVIVLAALAGLLVANVGGVERDQSDVLVASELATIRKAALRFQADLGQPPRYVAELLQSPDPADPMGGWWWRTQADRDELEARGLLAWDPATGRGWNGPYVQPEVYSTSGGSDDLPEVRESRINAAGATETIDSDGAAAPPRRLSALRSDAAAFPQATTDAGRLVSHYQFVFDDPSGEVVARFVDDPTDADPAVIAELRLGVKP
jgi:prepilin-type N-terminal cleavage/methylation domain-containing protein